METNEILQTILSKLEKLESNINLDYESEKTNELNEALAKSYLEYQPVIVNRENPYFKTSYADLDIIMNMVRPILAKYNLSITQRTILNHDGSTLLQTRLWHSSGQWIESRAKVLPAKNDLHCYDSAVDFLKRSQLKGLLNITINTDPSDDDAEMDMASAREIISKGTSLNLKYNPKKESLDTITKEQIEEIEYELGDYLDIAEELLDKLRLRSIADMPKSMYPTVIKRIREIKNARNNPQYKPNSI